MLSGKFLQIDVCPYYHVQTLKCGVSSPRPLTFPRSQQLIILYSHFHTQCFFLTARARDQLCQDATIISHDQEYEFINAATNLAESCNPAGLSRLGRLHRRIWTLHFKIVRRPFCPGTFNCHKSGCLQHPLAFFINLRWPAIVRLPFVNF
jgi:hypothetical protein